MKKCTICKTEKSEAEFNKNCRKKDGLQTKCKQCSKELSKKYYKKHKKYHANKRINKREENKKFVYNYLQGKRCIDCNQTYHPAALDFDHVRGEKVAAISKMIFDGYSIESIKEEIEKCEIRCANCHRIKTAETHNWYGACSKAANALAS